MQSTLLFNLKLVLPLLKHFYMCVHRHLLQNGIFLDSYLLIFAYNIGLFFGLMF